VTYEFIAHYTPIVKSYDPMFCGDLHCMIPSVILCHISLQSLPLVK